eukprot:COSAG01_NODE_6031_length_3889_cov_6.715567_1_plen_503_part_00
MPSLSFGGGAHTGAATGNSFGGFGGAAIRSGSAGFGFGSGGDDGGGDGGAVPAGLGFGGDGGGDGGGGGDGETVPGGGGSDVGCFSEALRACEALRAPTDEPGRRLAAAELLRAYFVRGDLGTSSRLFMQHRGEFITAALDAMVASAGEPSHVQRVVLGLIIAMEPALVEADGRQRLQQQQQGGFGAAFGGGAAPVRQPNQHGTHVMEMLCPMTEPGSWGCLLGMLGAPMKGEDAERCADRAAHLLAALAAPMLAAAAPGRADAKCEAMLCGWAEQLPMLLACFERACLRPPRAEHEHGAVLSALRTDSARFEAFQRSDPDQPAGMAFGGMPRWRDPILLWRGIGCNDAVAARQGGFGSFGAQPAQRYGMPALGEQLSFRLGTPAAPAHFACNIGTVLQTLLLAPPPPGGLVPGGAQALHQAVRRAALRVLRHTLGQIDVCLAMLRAEARTAANLASLRYEAGWFEARRRSCTGALYSSTAPPPVRSTPSRYGRRRHGSRWS